jgi:hypothetical protein
VSDHEAVRRTLAEFGHRADSVDLEGWVQLFAPDGAMHFNGQTYRGHETLAAFIAEDQAPDRRGVHFNYVDVSLQGIHARRCRIERTTRGRTHQRG